MPSRIKAKKRISTRSSKERHAVAGDEPILHGIIDNAPGRTRMSSRGCEKP
jgi:hypothetical protein